MHLLFEGQVSGPLTVAQVRGYLLSSIMEAKMSLVLGPHVFQDSTGIQGFCILAESHTACHVTEDNYVYCDLFSCQAFNPNIILNCAEKHLGLKISTYHIIHRGLEYLED